jgi:hypothetical protein
MTSNILQRLFPMLGLSLVLVSGCIKSVCETKNDCPAGNVCNAGACIKACAGDDECPSGKFCDRTIHLCQTGCRDSSECPSDYACVQNKCWPVKSSVPGADAGSDEDGGAPVCSCLRAPHACLVDINPASSTVGTSVCEPSDPPRATLMFFGNVGCSHCQSIFGQLLEIESQLRGEGLDPTLAFVQLKDWDCTGAEVTSTFPTHRGPVLQDTEKDKMWDAYGADWYEVKIIDTHGCLSAFFASPETYDLISGGQLKTTGSLLKQAWISAMGNECHVLVDAGVATGSGL